MKDNNLENNKILNKEEQINLGKKILLSMNKEYEKCLVIKDLSKTEENIDAIYLCIAIRGGGAIIVGADGKVLFEGSQTDFDKHLKEYKMGKRTDINIFKK